MAAPSRSSYVEVIESAWRDHLAPRAAGAPTVISTFAGAGGSSLGFSMAGYRELLAVEWDDHAVACFRANFPHVPVYHGDIAKLSVDEVLRRTGLKPGELDVFDGSPPCQGFSTAGKRSFGDQRNQLVREYMRLLKGLQPKAFVMENVSGMVKGHMKLIFAECLRELKACGYKVSARLLNAMYFNVPQSRQRLIFVGVRDDLEIAPTHPSAQTKPISCKEALVGVVPKTHAPLPKGHEVVFPYIKQGKAAIDCVPKGVLAKYIPKMVNNAKFSFGGICKRLHSCKQAPTITKIFRSYSEPVIHFSENRYLAIEELQTLHSFPSSYKFQGKYVDAYARIGNSVPPLFMRAIATHLRDHILKTNQIAA